MERYNATGFDPESGNTSPLTPNASRVSRIRVLLVDDHAMIREGLRAVLEGYEVTVVGEAVNGEEAVAAVDRLRPDVVVMDINMPNLNGIEATALIKVRYPETIVVGLSVNAAEAIQEAMKRAGAHCLLTKEAAVEQLHGVIRGAVRDGARR